MLAAPRQRIHRRVSPSAAAWPRWALLLVLTAATLPLLAQSIPHDAAQLFPASPFDRGAYLQAHPVRGVPPEIVRLLMTGAQGGELPIEALALPHRASQDGTPISLLVEIDGASFLEHSRAQRARVEVYAYALAESGRIAGYLAEGFQVDLSELGERIWQSGLKLFSGLRLPAGSYTLRVVVRSFESGAWGTRQISGSTGGRGGTES